MEGGERSEHVTLILTKYSERKNVSSGGVMGLLTY